MQAAEAAKAGSAGAPPAALEADYLRFDVLPTGIARVTDEVIGAERLMGGLADAACGPVRVAAFDFDGTSIDGNSPVTLVRYLGLRRRLSPGNLFLILLWAGAYKVRLPQNEAWVRGRVFSAFKGKPVGKVNKYLWRFYDTEVDARFRPAAGAEMQRHLDAGHAVVCVSASFEPIIAEAMTKHPIQFGIATRMQVTPEGTYLNRVLGKPTEGPAKLEALARFADERFGKGNWVLDSAYGDHHSDRALLAAAEHAFAVCPDRPLTRTARERSYAVLDWER